MNLIVDDARSGRLLFSVEDENRQETAQFKNGLIDVRLHPVFFEEK